MEDFFPQIQVKTKKKGLHQKWNAFFPRIEVETCAQVQTTAKLLGGDADIDHTQINGGIQSNYWGGYIPPTLPPGFGTPGSLLCLIILYPWFSLACFLFGT